MVKVLNKIPANTEIEGNTRISVWNGNLAVVYIPRSDSEFDPKKMAKIYSVFYIIGTDNKIIPFNSQYSWMKGKHKSRAIGDQSYVKNPLGGHTYFYMTKENKYYVKTTYKELNEAQLHKYTNYLTKELGFIDVTDWKINKKSWIFIFKKGFDEFENINEPQWENIYEFINFYFRDEIDEATKVKRIKGVYAYYKSKPELRYIIKNN